jgi:hypothetical protein
MESWRRAWKGSGVPVAPYEDTEWVAQRREFLASLPSEPNLSDEEAAHAYRLAQAQWIKDHLEQIEDEDPALAARIQEEIDKSRG